MSDFGMARVGDTKFSLLLIPNKRIRFLGGIIGREGFSYYYFT
jgi:hypothetical protein